MTKLGGSVSHLLSLRETMPGLPTEQEKANSKENRPGIEQIVSELRRDEDLQEFLESGFDPARHVGQVVHEGRVAAALQNAKRAQEILSARVREEVIERKEALLAEVEAVAALEKEVSTVANGVSTLSGASSALVEALEGPHIPMQRSVTRMRNLCDAADLLAAMARFRYCTKKLSDAGLFPIDTSMASDPAVLPGAAEAMKELEALIAPNNEPKLEKVDGLRKSIMSVRKASPELRRRVAAILKAGLAERNQVEVESAVSAFYSLGVLHDRVNSELSRLLAETQSALHRGLEAPWAVNDAKKRSGTASNALRPTPDVAVNRNIHVWNSLDKMLGAIAEACCKAMLLQQVLSKNYCEETYLSLLHEPIASNFIDSMAKTLSEQIAVLNRTRHQRPSANVVFLALAEGFPRLHSSITAMVSRIEAFACVSPPPIINIAPDPKYPFIPNHAFIEKSFMSAVSEIKAHYLSDSLERLTRAVLASFNKRKQVSESEALAFAKLLAQELTAAKGDNKLLQTASNNVAMALRLYKSHAEDYAAATAPDVDQRRSGRETKAWHLLDLHNSTVTLVTYARRILGVSEDGSGELSPAIKKEVESLSTLAGLFLDGPFSQCREELQRSMQRMHFENLETEPSDEGCNFYVLDLTTQLSLFTDVIISPLAKSLILGQKTLELARWLVSLFTRHVSLVRSMTDEARIRLSTDVAHLELAIEHLCPIRVLGVGYKQLRAVRSLLLIPAEDLLTVEDDTLTDEIRSLPRIVVAGILIARANSKSLLHPSERRNLSPNEYMEWIDQNSEEAWEEIQSTLSTYEATVSAEDRLLEFKAIRHLVEFPVTLNKDQ